MPRPEKVQAVADIKERIQNAQAVFLAEYAGLSVAQQQRLRRELKANGAEFKVMKMTLARIATAELNIDTLDEHLVGPTGITIADGDVVAAAKVLKDFSKANEVFRVKGGLLGLDYLTPERVSELADIEPRDVLLAKIAGLFAAPMSNVAGLFVALLRDVLGLTQALIEKREASGEVLVAAAAPEPAVVADVEMESEAAIDADAEAPTEATASLEEPTEGEDSTEGDVPPVADADEEVVDAEPEAVADEAPEASAEQTADAIADDSEEAEAAVDSDGAESEDDAMPADKALAEEAPAEEAPAEEAPAEEALAEEAPAEEAPAEEGDSDDEDQPDKAEEE